jgi:hypothetical protein
MTENTMSTDIEVAAIEGTLRVNNHQANLPLEESAIVEL